MSILRAEDPCAGHSIPVPGLLTDGDLLSPYLEDASDPRPGTAAGVLRAGSEREISAWMRATRDHPDIALGASPRGALALYKTSQALAALRGRDYVLPDDIKILAPLTLAHRLIVSPQSQLRGRTAETILSDILEQTELEIDPTA